MTSMASIPLETVRNPKPVLDDLGAIKVGIDALRSMTDEDKRKFLASERKEIDLIRYVEGLQNSIEATIKFMSSVVAQ